MAKPKKEKPAEANQVTSTTQTDDFAADLIKSINKERGARVAYNLAVDDSPTIVKRWISSGSRQLDYLIRNAPGGGYPEGRIVEIFGPPGIGKSHIATQICVSTQRMGGIAVYVDAECATSVENIKNLGVNVKSRFVYIQEHCTETIFSIIESTILKAKSMHKDVPVTIIWDSLAGSSPKAELEGDYDKDSIGLQARALSKGMRKITNVIGSNSVLLVVLNQIRTKIGEKYGDPDAPPGGKAVPFHASVRIKLSSGAVITDDGSKDGEPIGINVNVKVIKNRLAPPFRKCNFEIHFGIGIKEHEQLFDLMRPTGEVLHKGMLACVEGTGAWKTFYLKDHDTLEIVTEKKFYKIHFHELWKNPEYLPYLEAILEKTMVRTLESNETPDIDPDSYVDVKAVADLIEEEIGSDE
jgi:recombination protein RecA